MKIENQTLKRIVGKVTSLSPKINKTYGAHQKVYYNTVLALAVILLTSVTVFTATKTSEYFSTSADALIATQQLSDGVRGNTIALPASHSNILMMPVLYIQGHLQYDYSSFKMLNILLALTTVGAWGLLLVRLLGRKYEVLIVLLLATLVLSSIVFNISIGNTTFRNLAYPIALWFILVAANLLKTVKLSRLRLVETVVSAGLFVLVLAGDSFFNYSAALPILIVVAWMGWRTKAITDGMLRVVGLVFLAMFGATVLKWLLAALGIIYFDHAFLPKPTIVSYDHLLPSIWVSLRQLMELQGGLVFGQPLRVGGAAYFINLAILLGGTYGIGLLLFRLLKRRLNTKWFEAENNFALSILAVCYVVVLLLYIVSGYVVTEFEGRIVDYMNTRYITFLPLITVAGFVWLLIDRCKSVKIPVAAGVLVLLGMVLYAPSVTANYATAIANKPSPTRASVDEIIGILAKNGVSKVVTDFWYGPPIRFWSNNVIRYAPQIQCDRPLPFDSREDWFMTQKDVKSALVVDRGGMNFGYWGCTDEELAKIYGEPVKKFTVDGIDEGDVVDLWLYDKDVTDRMQAFPAH